MDKVFQRKLMLSFLLYSLSLIVCAALGSFMLYSHLYGSKVSYLKYDDLQKVLKGQPDLAKRFVSISKYILPTVVNVTSRKVVQNYENPESLEEFFHNFFNTPRSYRSSGSGFVISEDGEIVTNYHVVGNSKELYVTFINRKSVKAELVGGDPKTDIALLRIQSQRDLADLKREQAFQVAKLGTSGDLQVGEMVLAVGNPFALSHSVSFGIISATGRHNVGIATYENFIQTDAAVNPGNSGGPLISVRTGKIIGINTAILSKSGGFQGIAFTIPIDMAKKVIEDIRKKGKVERGYLGVSIQDVNEEVAQLLGAKHNYGVLVRRVYPGTAAEQAGLRSGDIIVEFKGKKIENVNQLRNEVAMTTIGKTVPLVVDRKGKIHTFQITIQSQESLLESSKKKVSLGIALKEITPEVVEKYNLKVREGLLIEMVRERSLAARVGLRVGQVIVSVNQKTVRTLKDFEGAIRPLHEGKSLVIEGVDGDTGFYVIIRP